MDTTELKKLAEAAQDNWPGSKIFERPECERFIDSARPDVILALIADNERLANNRDMWKGQSERQAERLERLHADAILAAKKLRSAEICHPRAVETLVDEARAALSDYLPDGWPVSKEPHQ